MNRFRTSAVAGLLTVMLAACASNSGAATPTPSPTPTPVPTPSTGASASGLLPSFSLPSNAKELEALIPDTLGGVKVTKGSMKGSDFVNSSSSNPELKTFLDSIGKSLNDVSAAFGFVASGSSGSAVLAFRVQGVDNAKLVDAFKSSSNISGTTMTWTSANVGGKNVQEAKDPDTQTSTYVYGTADLLFLVETNDTKIAQEALQHLP
ncbi:MAG: hypothetical protein E6J50_06740 [Chloroflexi bacterium]|nr:MAG: hypothetical protein E6J50_06740 [Chloroflexota bacterium]